MSRCVHGLRAERCPTCTTRTLIEHLTTAVEWLAASLLPGTHKAAALVHYEDKRTTEQRDLARLEREQRVDIAPGESPPPYNLEVADLLSELLAEADTMADKVADNVEAMLLAWAGSWAQNPETLRPPAASSAFADPAPFLLMLHDLIGYVTDPDIVEDVADRCQHLSDRAAQVLGLVFDGQLLDATCPWCQGRTDRHPEGGRRTLRVRMSQDDDPRALIVCEGGYCDPGSNSGLMWKHLPAWDLLNEGDWLARCIQVRDDAATCRCGRPVLRSGKPGRPAQHCSDECRRAADAERQRLGRAS
jgi:hypothetical protein